MPKAPLKYLTNDLKAFEQMMKEQRKENSYPEFEFEIDTEEDSPADILLQVSGRDNPGAKSSPPGTTRFAWSQA